MGGGSFCSNCTCAGTPALGESGRNATPSFLYLLQVDGITGAAKMLTSNRWEIMGELVSTSTRSGDNFTRPVKLGYVSFSVSPDPCDNRGDFRHPNGYSFIKEEKHFLHGRKTNVYYEKEDLSLPPAARTVTIDNLVPGYIGPLSVSKVAPSPWNRALEKLVDAIRDSEANLSTSVGEGRETLEMLQAVARSSAKALAALRKARRSPQGRRELSALLRSFGKDFRDNPLQRVGGAWLAWSVGLKPLLADLENIRNHALTDKPTSLMFHCKSRASSTITESEGDLVLDGATTFTRNTELKHSHRVAFGVNLRIVDLHQFENWRAGLTLRPSLAWELTTLSFVVDYFYNVGQYLQLLEASICNNGFSFAWGWCSETTLREERGTVTEHYDMTSSGLNPRNVSLGNYSSSYTRRTKSRRVLDSLPTPVAPILKIPTASGPLLNIAALLSQILSEKK